MGAKGYVLVVDAGTSGPRSLVFDESGQVVGLRASQWEYLVEDEGSSLARAFDPRALWQDLCQLMRGSLENAQVPQGQVAAVSVTSQRQGVVFLDSGGHEIYAGPNLDLRAVFEGAAIDQDHGDRVYQATGHLPSFFLAPAKLRWFQLHRPEAYARIASVVTLADWLAWRLTGALASEASLAGEAGLLDIHRRTWCSDLLEELGLLSNAAPLAQAGTVVGRINEDASRETGLLAGTPVVTSGADTQCGLLGMGVTQERQVGIVAGWSAPLQMVARRPLLSPEAKTWAGCFLEPGKWVLESSAGDVGNSYRWLAHTLWGGGPDAFQRMDQEASAAPVGAEGTLAFLGPPRMDMTSLGMRPGGFIFPVPLTFSDLGRGHIARAALEAIACTVKGNLAQIESQAGSRAKDITLGGGMTRTPTFVRILADVLGRNIRVSPAPHVSALGAYLCARKALGEFASLEEASASVQPSLRTVEPDPLDAAGYQGHYERWLELSDALAGLSF